MVFESGSFDPAELEPFVEDVTPYVGDDAMVEFVYVIGDWELFD